MITTKTGGNEHKIKKKTTNKIKKKTMHCNNINSLLLFAWELNIKLLGKLKTFVNNLVLINFIHSLYILNEISFLFKEALSRLFPDIFLLLLKRTMKYYIEMPNQWQNITLKNIATKVEIIQWKNCNCPNIDLWETICHTQNKKNFMLFRNYLLLNGKPVYQAFLLSHLIERVFFAFDFFFKSQHPICHHHKLKFK